MRSEPMRQPAEGSPWTDHARSILLCRRPAIAVQTVASHPTGKFSVQLVARRAIDKRQQVVETINVDLSLRFE